MKMKTQSNNAFTLIELLTVIAIIGILAAILIPVVGAVRENARAAKCTSNMRQLGQGIHMYAQENGGRVPPANNREAHRRAINDPNATNTGMHSTFHGSIWPYVFEGERLTSEKIRNVAKEPSIYHCPTVYGTYGNASAAPAEIFYSGQANDNQYGTYSYAMANQAAPGTSQFEAASLDSLSTSTMTVMVVESFYWNTGTNGAFYQSLGLVPHNGSANFLFYDGHVARHSRNQIPDLTERSQVFWYGDNATN